MLPFLILILNLQTMSGGYPAGAQDDSRAPYNQEDDLCPHCDGEEECAHCTDGVQSEQDLEDDYESYKEDTRDEY